MRYFVLDVMYWVASIAAIVFGCFFVLPIYLVCKLIKKTGCFLKKIFKRRCNEKMSEN